MVGLTIAATAAGVNGQAPAQQPPPTEGHGGPTPPGTPPPAQAPRPQPQGGGFPQGPARFPAHQRPPADPAVVERGRGLYVGACGACHGVDARGGQLGGPNLLRSEVVLNDKDGELIFPVVKNGRPGTLMPPMAMPEADVKTIATYLHHLQAQGSNQGGPPPGEAVPLNILVGDPKAGAKYFAARCTACHSAEGDLKGLAARIAEPVALQNAWVSGGRALGGRGRGFRPPSERSRVTATITWPSGEKAQGRLLRIDDFLVTIAQADGSPRTIRRVGDVPAVEINDPLQGHRELLGVLTDTNMHDVTAYLATLK
jgi:cytochrome c oxidase cbb3-type subunit 3